MFSFFFSLFTFSSPLEKGESERSEAGRFEKREKKESVQNNDNFPIPRILRPLIFAAFSKGEKF